MDIPTIEELHAKNLEDFRTEFDLKETIKPTSFFFIFSKVLAGALFGYYWFAQKLIDNFFLDTTTDSEIIKWWGEFLSIPPKDGSYAEGTCKITVTGTESGEVLGEILTNINGDEYEVTEYDKVNNVITVKSMKPGIDKNLSEGKQLIFQKPVKGVENIAVSNNITGGSNEELIEEYRQRLITVSRTVRTGGNRQDYINWAQEVGGVGRVFVQENYMGLGTVGVSFVTDDRDRLIPNEDLVEDVKKHIDKYRPLGSVVHVYQPIEAKVHLEIQLTPSNQEIKDRVTEYLNYLFKRDADLGGTVYFSRISEAISMADGEESHRLNGMRITTEEKPNSSYTVNDIKLGADEVAVLGDIEWI